MNTDENERRAGVIQRPPNAYRDIARGKAIAAARELGVEMIDAERLNTLLEDLENEGLITIDAQQGDPNPGERGIEILRG